MCKQPFKNKNLTKNNTNYIKKIYKNCLKMELTLIKVDKLAHSRSS